VKLKETFDRYRTEIIVFSIGAALFAGGLFNVIASNRITDENVVIETRPSVPGPSALGEVGPSPGVDVATYIDTKRKLLADRAKQAPKESSFAVVSFDRYQSAAETDGFVKARKLEAHSVEVRVPLPGYPSEALSLEGASVPEVLASWRQRSLATLTDELAELRKIIPTVDDKEFKSVYQEDAESRSNAIAILEGDGSVVFGLLLRGSHADLLKAGQVAGVRLVDLPEEPAITPETHRFKALPPQ
jgi:hypothetical protein